MTRVIGSGECTKYMHEQFGNLSEVQERLIHVAPEGFPHSGVVEDVVIPWWRALS